MSLQATKTAGVVVSAGKMMKTVTVRLTKKRWDKHLKRYYPVPYNILVNDPNSSLVQGDVVTMDLERHSKHVRHTVKSILAPFGTPVDERPPLLSQEHREAIYNEKKARKRERRERRAQEAIEAGERGETYVQEEHGRQVLPGGKHKFGGINEESWKTMKKTLRRERQGVEREAEKEQVRRKSDEDLKRQNIAKQSLEDLPSTLQQRSA